MQHERHKIFHDFLNLVLTGLVTGVLFAMALTGAVFLLSGSAGAG
jgi:hypothetical protein